MKKLNSLIQYSNFYMLGLVLMFVLRLVLNAYVPLMDATEARYSEIARIMAETNNFIIPQIDYGVPFMAKPPLSSWLSALSIKLFGVNEFAVRFPSFLLSLGIVFLIGKFAKEKKLPFFLPGFIILTLPEFLLHVGVVSTDTALVFCLTVIMISYWRAINQTKLSYWGYLFFISLGFGLLAKGPIIFILTIPPIVLWTLLFKVKKENLLKIPWIVGSLITLAIAVPWYYLAESKTKGFLDYFIVGEHFRRYFDANWKDDLYGFAKHQPLGMIWLFLFASAFPWIQFIAIKLWNLRKELIKDKWAIFLLFWLLWTPLFFTISTSLIHTYTLPVMVPIALLILHYWEKFKNKKAVILTSLIFPLLVIITLALSLIDNNLEKYSNTDKYFVKGQIENTEIILYHINDQCYSGKFYTKGKIKSISYSELYEKIKLNNSFKIIIPNRFLKDLDKSALSKLQVMDFNNYGKIYLYSAEIKK